MGPYRVETRSESFYLTAPKERLTNTAATWSIPAEDVSCVLAALNQIVGQPHSGYSAWLRGGRQITGDHPMPAGDYPATSDGQRVTLSGPAYLTDRAEGTWPYNSIELGYDAVEPLRDALQAVR
ncbi:unnamed protein product [[Actinomadura] parvosata subsp. kistnae]|uniref:Uncharacterized protein n=2 Tax=Nonomuraea TaxID=83681 RepID=A0A1U9ZXT6_9ACTN|nr:hypothetical protein BKM31_16015 [Nonomuraea sp. ATCC 55076]SPL98278.1 unnamed protein product [Actinomadura parvosata subsp. kistnae]